MREGTFQEGALPTDDAATTPEVIYVANVSYVITQGRANLSYSGLASADAWSVAVAFPDLGDGYWVVPLGAPDVTQDDNLLFEFTADFTREVPAGLQAVSFVAIDGDGEPGPRYDTTLCVLPDYADGNFAACSEDIPPQDTVLSLYWDRDVDLDLIVVAPNGKVVNPKSPTTALGDDDEEPSIGELSRDSNGNCHIDSIRLESLIFEDTPPAGDYRVYASLFSPCGEPSTNFELSLHRRADQGDGTWSVERSDLASGALLAQQADGGASNGLYISTLTLP